MGFEPDEEILQDFLVEAGELLEQLSEQLVELEQNPEDRDLLNAIFRGFPHCQRGWLPAVGGAGKRLPRGGKRIRSSSKWRDFRQQRIDGRGLAGPR